MNLSSSSEDEGYSSNDDDIARILNQKDGTHEDFGSEGNDNEFSVKPASFDVAAKKNEASSKRSKQEIGEDCYDSDSNSFEDVDWEDASMDEEETEEQDSKMPASSPVRQKSFSERRFPSNAVEINMNRENEDGKIGRRKHDDEVESKKRKRQRINKIQHVPEHMQNLLRDLQRSHILASISRAIYLSSALGTTQHNDIWSIAYSLVPFEFFSISTSELDKPYAIPTYQELKKFSFWFFDFINDVEVRRQRNYRSNTAAGAPRRRRKNQAKIRGDEKKSEGFDAFDDDNAMEDDFSGAGTEGSPIQRRIKRILAYLSPTNDDRPQEKAENFSLTSLDKLLVFIGMTRSIGWRIRFVNSLQPTTRDLTVDHPLFSSTMKNTFQAIAESVRKSSEGRTKRPKKRRVNKGGVSTDEKIPSTDDSLPDSSIHDEFFWAEALCTKRLENNAKSHSRWIHIDPSCKLFDRPSQVEAIDRSTFTVKKSKRGHTIMQSVSWVIGIENFHNLPYDITKLTTMPVYETTRLADVTPRYANKWSLTLKKRGANAKEVASGKCANKWWSRTLKHVNNSLVKRRELRGLSDICLDKNKKTKKESKISCSYKVEKQKINDTKEEEVLVIEDSSEEEVPRNEEIEQDLDDLEQQEFASIKEKEAIPTNKASFKNHPLYVIPSALKSQEVLAPDARKRVCGIFKGEMVYRRSDASTAYTSNKWLYRGRKVREKEIPKPAKVIKARKQPMKKGFQALSSYGATTDTQDVDLKANLSIESDGKNRLYGIWQTVKWNPPFVGPDDPIPVNDHRNVELALLNPGLVHLELYRIAKVAKQLGVPYAPCLLGFEGHGGNRTPTIRGIVVHEHNADLLREAHVEMQSQMVEKEYKERQKEIYGKWKRLIKGVVTKERIAREYAND